MYVVTLARDLYRIYMFRYRVDIAIMMFVNTMLRFSITLIRFVFVKYGVI